MSDIERQSNQELDLRAILGRLWRGKYWIAASTVIVTAVFALLAFQLTPTYQASVLLAPASADRGALSSSLGAALGSLGGLASLAGVTLGPGDSGTEEAIAVLQSRQFTETFIRENNLLPVLFASKWDAAGNKWRVAPDKQPTGAQAFAVFDAQRTVVRDKRTGLVTVQVEWSDRALAAAWANELIERLNLEMRARAIKTAEASVDFLEKELASTSVLPTREAINRLIEAQVRQRMLSNVTQEYAFRIVDKALAPDIDDFVKPKRALLILFGALLGLMAGASFAILREMLR